jgi:hypothetical protein
MPQRRFPFGLLTDPVGRRLKHSGPSMTAIKEVLERH